MSTSTIAVGASYVEPGSPFVRALATGRGEAIEAAGVRGASVSKWLPHAVPLVRGRDVLVAEFGGNGAPTIAQVRSADAALRAAGARSVAWIQPPRGAFAAATAAKREAATRAILAADVPVITHAFVATSRDLAADRQHLTATGYAKFAAAVAASRPFSLALVAVAALALFVAARASGAFA